MCDLFSNDIYIQLDYVSIDVKDISKKDITFYDIYNMSHKISISFESISKIFYTKLTCDKMLEMNMSPIYGECYNNYRYRYMIVKDMKDYYLIPLKIIDPINKKLNDRYFIICDDILSLNGSNASFLYDILKSIECIKYKQVIINDVNNTSDWKTVNFYCSKDTFYSLSGKKIREIKRSCRIIENFATIKIITCRDDDFFRQALLLLEYWKNNRYFANITAAKKIIEICFSRNFPIIACYYNHQLIGYKTIIIEYGKFAFNYENKDISSLDCNLIAKDFFCNDMDKARLVKKHLGNFMEYKAQQICIEDMGLDALYVDGVHGHSDKKLFEHKRRHYKDCIYYKLVSL